MPIRTGIRKKFSLPSTLKHTLSLRKQGTVHCGEDEFLLPQECSHAFDTKPTQTVTVILLWILIGVRDLNPVISI
jgi:hypothetical protein